MLHGSYSLGETAVKQKMVRLVCDKCGRRGNTGLTRLLEQYGPDIAMPDLRHELALLDFRLVRYAATGGASRVFSVWALSRVQVRPSGGRLQDVKA